MEDGKIYIAYGANLPGRHRNPSQDLAYVVKRLRALSVNVERTSKLWRSKAWPNPDDPPFHNAVFRVSTDHLPYDLLQILHQLEVEAGRIRNLNLSGMKNTPRVLDLDLIAYGDEVVSEDGGMQLPHPRAHERGFVMGPLAEIDPDWMHPVLKRTARELAAKVTVGADAYPLAG
ncbi:2-amino-4-hydroxy-6-hydroxymethyldihydropteridine diphosphokinase [Asticcacaulis sp. ZE23SCel15]|uniref:2-amino-4-hydroxy-6- hydroxymethyldihydropteridine diphosphokinase n=1 Tax=Asticcacaulis sp. ZE23SCel15 TaxID=3059027 RepID=UPI00265D7362|nr:2-amino-4-hydroxy-6-hydroxymethyldihydropteridine diphosphokinase [Asticcacaulis sp. ZE23SCel15]WKL56478.1 2-amino-4-hydroxy-6-hydroxymethyldihydropteridine diphosphokinase [Asticcacaulis sp. ZE23SCel15]